MLAGKGGAVFALASGGDALTISPEQSGLVPNVSGGATLCRLLATPRGASPRPQLVSP